MPPACRFLNALSSGERKAEGSAEGHLQPFTMLICGPAGWDCSFQVEIFWIKVHRDGRWPYQSRKQKGERAILCTANYKSYCSSTCLACIALLDEIYFEVPGSSIWPKIRVWR